MAPDIDLSQSSDTLEYASIPFRKLVTLVRLLIAVVVLFVFVVVTSERDFLTQSIGVILGVSVGIVIIRAVPDFLHRLMPGHRKLTHELPFWVITGLLGVLAIHHLLRRIESTAHIQTYLPLAVGIPIVLGVVTHISMDTVSNYVRSYAPDPVKRRAA